APKGVGALYIRKGSSFEPMIRGGGQEGGYRSGTENVPYIVGLGEAAAIMKESMENGALERVESLRNRLESGLERLVEQVEFNGAREHRTGNVAHVSFPGRVASALLPLLDAAGLQCSAGSACMTGKSQPSHVQKAMGFSDERSFSSLRLSLSIFTTQDEVDEAVQTIVDLVSN
ncbi:MAG: aminotransferase class V-fold PLP-dependent enzyme, partial [Verrucomicrobiota bacterium]